jgi:hypothetical protein
MADSVVGISGAHTPKNFPRIYKKINKKLNKINYSIIKTEKNHKIKE